MSTPSNPSGILGMIAQLQDIERFREQNWEGSFADYLEIVRQKPEVTRNAYQRLYDLIMSFGTESYTEYRKPIVRYKFFDDPFENGKDAVFGIDVHLMKLLNVLKSAALQLGPEKRVILLHGPVGSAKSTIVRLFKKGLEWYSRQNEGALYTFEWRLPDGSVVPSPMHEEPLRLVPPELRAQVVEELNKQVKGRAKYRIEVDGDLDPVSRYLFRDAMKQVGGDWTALIERIRVKRLLLSERDRVGVGTFQPKDEKNQDSTELTGDINYRKIAEFGSDSDPRAFNFDGEFCVANRGIIEFVEMLKLDVAFLYDLLGASQEHVIKPKKFAQTHIDEVILGHSVAGDTPIPYRAGGCLGWDTLEGLHARFGDDPSGLEVLAWNPSTRAAGWTPVRRVFRHRFAGEWLTTSQKWGTVETTPNHSILDREGNTFYPEEKREVLALRLLPDALGAEGDCLDVVAGIPGFVGHERREAVGGGPLTRPAQLGWARLDLPRHATQIRAVYHLATEADALADLLTVMVWFATEGHCNTRNGGVVITQANRHELERVRAAYARVTTATGSIDEGAKTDSAWRLYLGSEAIRRFLVHHCGELSAKKRLPDFVFRLPRALLQHVFDELMKTDGTRRLHGAVATESGAHYRANFFDFKTTSPVLAAQVGTLATMLGHDYGVYLAQPAGKLPHWRVRYVSGEGKRGGRHKRFEARLHRRAAKLGDWAYDIECVGIHNFVCGVGNVVCHNTNEPEYRKLQSNEFMEALRDRTIKIDVPYITRWSQEARIYGRDFSAKRVHKHIAPHTLEMAAMWAVLTRLEDPKKPNLTVLQKMKLYDGRTLPGFTEDNVKELRKSAVREGMEGISPRYVQDKISNAMVRDSDAPSLNAFMVLNELESGLKNHSLINDEDKKKRYRDLLGLVKKEYEDIVKNEVQKAIAADETAIQRLCGNYIDNVKAYTQKERVRNPFTGAYDDPDERLMRSVEEKIDIAAARKDDFRRELMNYIGALALDGKQFNYKMNERLYRALELKLFEDQKDTIKLSSLVSQVVDPDTQAKIDIVKQRLIDQYGYDEHSATDVLNFVASIFARGDAKESG